MKRASALGIIFVLLLSWLASPPPARACSPPPPQPLFSPVFTFTFPDNTLSVTKAEYDVVIGQHFGEFRIEFLNNSQSVIYLLGESNLPIPVYQGVENYNSTDGLSVFFKIEPDQSIKLTDWRLIQLAPELEDRAHLVYVRPETLTLPQVQSGEFWIVADGKEIAIPIVLSYVENLEWQDNSANANCSNPVGSFILFILLPQVVIFVAGVVGLVLFLALVINKILAKFETSDKA